MTAASSRCAGCSLGAWSARRLVGHGVDAWRWVDLDLSCLDGSSGAVVDDGVDVRVAVQIKGGTTSL
jgi:hypothetical protein